MQGSRPNPLAWLAIAGLLATLTWALTAAPTVDAKVPKSSVKKLRKANCPPAYQVRVARSADPEEIQKAKRGVFRIAGEDVKITRDFNWTFDPVGSASFRARLHDLRWLDTLLYAYRTNGDHQALRRAKRIVVDWVKSNPRERPSTDRTWFDKVAGDRIAYIAYVTRAAKCEGMLGNKRLSRKLLGSVDTHSDFLAPQENYPVTNRGLFVDMGLILAGKQMRFLPGANKRRKQATRRFLGTVNELTNFEEGFWLEHSTTYQFLTIGVIERFLEFERRQRPALEQLLANMKDTAAWLVEPDKRWLQAGNSYQDRANGESRKAAGKQRGLRVLPESGLGFVRKKKEYLSFLANFHGPTHKHSDELSFDLFEKGSRLISDTGLPTKDPTKAYEFAVSAPAHNVLTVDGADFPRDAASAYGSGITASGGGDGWFAIEGRNPLLARQGVEHSRTLIYRPGFALIVADRVRSETPHSYRRYLQFGPDWRLDFLPEKLELHTRTDSFSVHSFSTVPEERRTVRGRKDPFGGFVFPDFGRRDKRVTAWFASEATSYDSAMTIATNPKRDAEA
ncbi:MAG: heparinase II/III domain-containing protein, partial [Solirubrobacterales bacterium]